MATPATNRGHRPFAIAVIVIAVFVAAYLDYAELANVSPTVGMKPATGPARSDCDQPACGDHSLDEHQQR
jgi:hypothetical protein